MPSSISVEQAEHAQPRRIALITGGASGLGLASGQRLAKEGLLVALADLDQAKVEQAAVSLPGAGHVGVVIDVTSETSVREAFATVEKKLGPIAVLATFAGIFGSGPDGKQPRIVDLPLDLWTRTMAVNTTGTFLCIKEYAKHRTARPVPNGRIITASSSGAQLGGYQATSAYCASKGAILSLTKAAARELAHLGVTANAIAPGPIDTPMLRAAANSTGGKVVASSALLAGRIGEPAEIAAAVSYLASIDAAFVTGATLDVNGGVRMQ